MAEVNGGARLEVLICTIHDEGLRRVEAMALPHVPGVRYVVSQQLTDDDCGGAIPASLLRDDLTVHRHHSRGLSRNRNEALRISSAPYLLIADDDLRYEGEALRRVIDIFDSNPSLDLVQFRFTPNDKPYSDHETRIGHTTPGGTYVTSFEMAVRRSSIVGRICFNEQFGIGSGCFGSGEDPLFLLTAVDDGLDCRYIPHTIAHHEGPTTGARPMTREVARGEGAVIARMYGVMGLPRVLLFVKRRHKAGLTRDLGVFSTLGNVLWGYIYGLTHGRAITRGCHS